jgi:hypothetical protein
MTDEPHLIRGEQRVNVDFDNTLTTGDFRYWEGERPEPDPEVVHRAREHYHAGGTLIIWTARPWNEANRIAAYLTEWQLPYHGLRCERGSGDLYVDDKAVHPDDL